MGRILKKKDPIKKKAQRVDKGSEIAPASAGQNGLVAKTEPAQKRVLTPAKPKAVGGEDNLLHKSLQFLREVRIELKKVTWPSRKQTMGSTVVVIVLVMVISLFLGVVDFGLSSLIRAVLP